MEEKEKLATLRLLFCPGIGDAKAKRLLLYCLNATAVFEEKKKNLAKIPGIGTKLLESLKNKTHAQRAEKELMFINNNRVQMLVCNQEAYPSLLKMCPDHPFILFARGKISYESPKISIVGTRKITKYGRDACEKLIDDMGDYNPIIISGMAYGADICAHKSAIKNNLQTIGVLGHGLDRMYPLVHKKYISEIEINGGFITEFPSGTTPCRENFPKRNRIIAGCSQATIIIEAAKKGGALITAHLAHSYNREVFALPGKTTDIFSLGCNHLIKTNVASMITKAKDLEYILGWTKTSQKPKANKIEDPSDLTESEIQFLNYFQDSKKLHIDQLSRLMNTPTHKIASELIELEIKGLIKPLPGKRFMKLI